MKIHDISKENRPRERLLRQGVSVLSDAELLAIILQNGCFGENAVDCKKAFFAIPTLRG
jgi:DNA repair protein RadC